MDQDLDAMLSRINHLTAGGDPGPANHPSEPGLPPRQPLPPGPPGPSDLEIDAVHQRTPGQPGPGGQPFPPGMPGAPMASGNPGGQPVPGMTPPPRAPMMPPPGAPMGQPFAGQPLPGQPFPGQPLPGQPIAPPQGQPGQPGIMRVNQPPAQQRGPGGMPLGVPGVPMPHAGGPPTGPLPAAPMSPAMAPPVTPKPAPPPEFLPKEPASLEEARLNDSQLEELVLKYLLVSGEASGSGISDQVKVPFSFIQDLLARLKYDQMIYFRDTAQMGDYVCSLTEKGRDRARGYANDCTYFGAAPVSLSDYCDSVKAQSLNHQNPTESDLKNAFSDLLVNPKMFLRLGSAMNSGRGMFLFGFPGNGKTSIAERVTRAFGEHIWIPRSIGVDGEIIRVFDPSQHTEAPLEDDDTIVSNHRVDKRWVRIERPTLIVGGELTMDNLELCINRDTGINEAPIQLKSNCGTLVIDDFGRQRMTTDELLNRWIVPLEKRYDFLNLPSGKKIQVPFDQLVVFSTNLEPKDLVDDAFLRRIPYKIEVENPTEAEFRELFKIMCPLMGFDHEQKAIDYLIAEHYKKVDRPFRCCQPRDLLLQVKNYCKYTQKPQVLSNENFDFAAGNYFSVM